MVRRSTGSNKVYTPKKTKLPADTSQSELCPAICLACSDDEESVTDEETVTDDDDPHVAGQGETGAHLGRAASVLAEKAGAFRHAALRLGPQGAPPVPDPRLLEWAMPKTCKPARHVCLAYATTKDVRQTLLAQAWREPRSFTTRYATLFAVLFAQERTLEDYWQIYWASYWNSPSKRFTVPVNPVTGSNVDP